MFCSNSHLTRRAFLRDGSLLLPGLGVAGRMLAAEGAAKPLLRVGLVTDLHYGDKEPTKTRFYREALGKLDEAVACFNRHRPDFVVELGDFIDEAPTIEQEIEWLQTIEKRFAQLAMPRRYVFGNHCVTRLTKAEFAEHTAAVADGHQAFEQGGISFIVLDACYRSDGTPYARKNFDWKDANVPAAELEWLQTQLDKATAPVIVLAHQRLDVADNHSVRNAPEVRALLEKSGKVRAVFQGHSHKNDYQQIAGIHYTTLVAMVEGSGVDNSGYTLLDIMSDESLRVTGFRRQQERALVRS